jgi:hypothetical protein
VRFENKNSIVYIKNNALAYYNVGIVIVNSGANPTIVYYNASDVKIYYDTSSLVRFENKNRIFHVQNALA